MNTRCTLRTLLPSLLITSCSALLAQVGNEYRLTSDAVIRECDIRGSALTNGEKLAPFGAKFTIVGRKNDDLILVFYDWYNAVELTNGKDKSGEPLDAGREAQARRYNYDMTRTGEQDRYFLITTEQLSAHAEALTSRFSPTYGALLLPVRYRPQTGLVSKDISLGGIGGLRTRINDGLSVGLMFGVAITSSTLDSASTEGKVLQAENRASATLPLGVLVQWERVQFGFFGGLDFLMDGKTDGWIYNGKPWLSLGIGLGLFTEDVNLKPGKNAIKQ